MKPASLLLCSLFGACILLAGCATPPKATGVSVSVVGFREAENSPVATRAIMTLHFASENLEALGFTSTTHQLYFADRYVGKAENLSPVGLPPQGSVNVDVTIDLENTSIVRQILSVSDQALYRLETVLHYTDGDNKVEVKVHAEGKVAIQGLEQAVR
jgi:LEA14-like dessication related protein